MNNRKTEKVDSLIDHLWSHGYLTLSRRYGKYLPAPTPVGNYEIDAVAKYKKKIAIGLVISEEDLDNLNITTKLTFLANSKPKSANSKVTLFVGVPNNLILKAEMIMAALNDEVRNRIKIVPIKEEKQKR